MGAKAALAGQFAGDETGQGRGQKRKLARGQMQAQARGRSLDLGHHQSEARIHPQQGVHLLRRDHADDGRQIGALVQ